MLLRWELISTSRGIGKSRDAVRAQRVRCKIPPAGKKEE
jgi:hypothetical protein